MSSNLARDIVYELWVDQSLVALVDAAVQVMVFELNFFAMSHARTEYFVLPDSECAQRTVRMRDACTEVSLNLCAVFHARPDGECSLEMVVSRGSALHGERRASEDVLLTHSVWQGLQGGCTTVAEAREQFRAAGGCDQRDAMRQWARCDEFGAQLAALLAP